MENKIIIPKPLEKSLNKMTESLLESIELSGYLNAKNEFESDPLASNLMQDLSTAQSELLQKQYQNQITQEDIQNIRNIQKNAQENEIFNSYIQSQQNAVAFLREVNDQISQLIGMDFASLAKNTKC